MSTAFFTVLAHIPQVQSLTEHDLRRVWETLEAEDKLRFLFYDGVTRSVDAFIDFMASPDVFAYLAADPVTGVPLALWFVNNFMGNAGCIHFCFTEAGLPHKEVIGRYAVSLLLAPGHLSALVGLTPKPFRHARRYPRRLSNSWQQQHRRQQSSKPPPRRKPPTRP